MKQYLKLLDRVLLEGKRKPTRAVLQSTGKNVDAISIFGAQLHFDLTEGFPLVTTKEVNFDAVAHELIWFLRGDTNIKYLNDNGVHIWDRWAGPDGDLGPTYGHAWRRGYTDQIKYTVLDGIEQVKADPTSPMARRLIVSAWNVAEIHRMALPPCHVLFQFSVNDSFLDCQLYQRSADLFLGVPFNIASYALLTHIIARLTGLKPGTFIHTFGDAHIYVNHVEQVAEQLKRIPHPLPEVTINPEFTDIDHLYRVDIRLHNYVHCSALKGEVAV